MKTLKWVIGAAVIALVGGIAVFLFVFSSQAPKSGGQFHEPVYQYFDKGASVGTSAAGADDLCFTTPAGTACTGTIGGSITAGSRLSYWYNDTGSPVYVTPAVQGWSSGTASTSLRVAMYATTTQPTTTAAVLDYATPTDAIVGPSALLFNQLYATSSTATTTNSAMATKAGTSNGAVTVPVGGYLVVLLQNASGVSNAPNPLCNGATCETATSTKRGISTFFWRGHYFR